MNEGDMTKNDVIAAEAASWLAQLCGGELSASDKLAFAEWMSRSPRHRQEIRELEALWGGVDDLLDELLIPEEKVSLTKVLAAWLQVRPFQFSGGLVTVCGAFVLLFLFVFTGAGSLEEYTDTFTYTAERGSKRSLTLSDGSIMHLSSGSIAEVVYTNRERRIRLFRGEAVFDVTRDVARPFRVYVGKKRVEAVGTSFLTRLVGDELELVVTEGRVRLDALSFENALTADQAVNSSENYQKVFVNEGSRVVSSDMQNIIEVDKDAIARYTAWMQGKHIFEGDALKHIASEISRHSTKTIVISDPELRTMKMGGVFETGQVDVFLSALEASLDVNIEYADDGLIYIKHRHR